MGKSEVRKGKRFERQVVRRAKSYGLKAKRAYASDGRALGEAKEVDVTIEASDGSTLRVSCKRRAKIASYLQPPDDAHAVVVREDRGEALAVVPLRFLLAILVDENDGGAVARKLYGGG